MPSSPIPFCRKKPDGNFIHRNNYNDTYITEDFFLMYFGIDLGTTNSVIAFSQMLPNGNMSTSTIAIDRIADASTSFDNKPSYKRQREKTLPSCVYYGNDVYVGDYARAQFKKYPGSVVKSVKSQMGNRELQGYPEIPDKTPADVSARILAHLKKYAEIYTKTKISDFVITVPANFGVEQREATMMAAEKAGFPVRNPNGSWKDILISEPNAVLYDLAHRILNGEVAPNVLDLRSKRRIMVFDIGGGTLDVTLQEMERDQKNPMSLKISEIATSRYTRLAGDDFDQAITERLYERLTAQLRQYEPSAFQRISSKKSLVKKLLTGAAEQLKIDMSAMVANDSAEPGWFGEFDDTSSVSVSISHQIGDERSYSDTIMQEEFEEMIAHFMGNRLKYSDYVGYSKNKSIAEGTILAPVLDVLEKAERYYEQIGEKDFKVDAVVLNGGMSKLYLIKKRLTEFFGFEPIETADPDLSVANGAAVYACIRGSMGESESYVDITPPSIEIVSHKQTEDLYLGLSAGAKDRLIREGEELPYETVIDDYSLAADCSAIEIPIKRIGEHGEEIVIARGKIRFNSKTNKTTKLRIEASFDQSMLISISASKLSDGGIVIESGRAELVLGDEPAKVTAASKIIPRSGTTLLPANEIYTLKTLCAHKKGAKKNAISEKIHTIESCGNPEDFAAVILEQLGKNVPMEFRCQLYVIAGKLIHAWSEEEKKTFVQIARNDILPDNFLAAIKKERVLLSNQVSALLGYLFASGTVV